MQAFAMAIERWNALSRAMRLAAATSALAIAAAAIVAAYLAHPARCSLFAAPLHADQLSEVEERLAAWNVAFTPLADNVVVDAARRNDLLLRLSLAGLPHAHLQGTAEALATVGALTPQTVVDAQTRAGLAGDVEAGLRGIDGIDDAQVIVAPAQPAEFADEQSREAQASVRLRMRGGMRLGAQAVAGIRAFVAASVAGLDPQHVTILDDRGVALGDGDASADGAEIERALQSALDSAFGEGTTIVRVRAEYRAQRVAERDVRRLPAGGAAIETATQSESFDDAGKRFRSQSSDADRGSETRELVSDAPRGTLARISTAIFVDERRAADLAKVRELAAAAAGYDAKRGDELAVVAVDFQRPLEAKRDVWWLLYGAIVPALPPAVLAIASIVALRIAAPSVTAIARAALERSRLRAATATATADPIAPARVRSALAAEPPHAAAAVISALPAATAAAVLELYPQHEREAIVARMQRAHAPLVGDPLEFLRRHG